MILDRMVLLDVSKWHLKNDEKMLTQKLKRKRKYTTDKDGDRENLLLVETSSLPKLRD